MALTRNPGPAGSSHLQTLLGLSLPTCTVGLAPILLQPGATSSLWRDTVARDPLVEGGLHVHMCTHVFLCACARAVPPPQLPVEVSKGYLGPGALPSLV